MKNMITFPNGKKEKISITLREVETTLLDFQNILKSYMKAHLPENSTIDFEEKTLTEKNGETYDLSEFALFNLFTKVYYDMSYLDQIILNTSLEDKIKNLTTIIKNVLTTLTDTAEALTESGEINELHDPEDSFNTFFEMLDFPVYVISEIWEQGFEDEKIIINENDLIANMFSYIIQNHASEKEQEAIETANKKAKIGELPEVTGEFLMNAINSGHVTPIVTNVLEVLNVLKIN